MLSFFKVALLGKMKKMSYGTSLNDKINFFYIAANFNGLGGIRTVSENFKKIFLTFLGLGTNVVKVSSVNSELLFQWDTLREVNLKLNKDECHFRCISIPFFGEIKKRHPTRPTKYQSVH